MLENISQNRQDNTSLAVMDQFTHVVEAQSQAMSEELTSQNWFFNNHHTKSFAKRKINIATGYKNENMRIIEKYSKPYMQARLPAETNWNAVFERVKEKNDASRIEIRKYTKLLHNSSGMSRKEHAEGLLEHALNAYVHADSGRDDLAPLVARPPIPPPVLSPNFLG